MDSVKYGALIIGCGGAKPEELAKLITKADLNGNDSTHQWTISNRYYTADIYLWLVELDKAIPKEVLDIISVQAIIVYSAAELIDLSELDRWLDCIKCYNSSVNMVVVCSNLENEKESIALKWCVRNSFELIVLESGVVNNDEESDMNAKQMSVVEEKHFEIDSKNGGPPNLCFECRRKNMYEKFDQEEYCKSVNHEDGINRVIEALHAHIWPNLIMKDQNYCKLESETDKLSKVLENQMQLLEVDENAIHNNLDDLETGFENSVDFFDSILCNLNELRNRTLKFKPGQRVSAAEDIVCKIWNSIDKLSDEEEK